MKQLSLLNLALIISFSSFAQLFEVGKESKAIEAKDKVLLVRLYQKGDSELKTFANDDEIVAKQNEMLKSVFSSSWKLNKTVEYVSKDEMDKRVKSDPEKYVVVDRSWGEDVMQSAQVKRVFTIFEVHYGFPKGKKIDAVFSMAFPDDALGELDYRFFVSQCNEYVQAAANGVKPKDDALWNPEKNIAEVKKSTLYLLEESFKGGLSEAKSNYCGKMETLPAPQLYKKITSEPEGSLFMTIMWSYKKNFYSYILVDAETYDMRGIIGMGGVKLSLGVALGDRNNSVGDVPMMSIPLYGNMGLHGSHFKYVCKTGAQNINY